MNKINGIILIVSCYKFKNGRIKDNGLTKSEYNGWKVIYVFGNIFIENDYILNENTLIIKCEDSYFHLTKKLTLALKFLYQEYEIKEGILRASDDLIFNEDNLLNFLSLDSKENFMGINHEKENEENPNIDNKTKIIECTWTTNYYKSHPEDFYNPYHNLYGLKIENFTKRPIINKVIYGTLYFISNYSCKKIIEHMEDINFNVMSKDKITNSYPYILEDISISYILYLNKIKSTYNEFFVFNVDSNEFVLFFLFFVLKLFSISFSAMVPLNYICIHTNIHRETCLFNSLRYVLIKNKLKKSDNLFNQLLTCKRFDRSIIYFNKVNSKELIFDDFDKAFSYTPNDFDIIFVKSNENFPFIFTSKLKLEDMLDFDFIVITRKFAQFIDKNFDYKEFINIGLNVILKNNFKKLKIYSN